MSEPREHRGPEQTEVVHACPPDAKAVTPCCGRTPFELRPSDRLTADPGLVTCTGLAEQSKPWPNPLDEAGRPICVCTLERACVMHADRAEQTQPSGYTPPPVGAPTWSGAYGATISERGDRLEIEWPNGRGMSWVAPKVIEGWVEQVNELRAERDAARGALRKSVDDQIQINVQRGEARADAHRLAAEVQRLRAALAEVIEVLRTSRGAGDAARVARDALAEPPPELHSSAGSPHVAAEVKSTDAEGSNPEGLDDLRGPLIDPDCRDGKHSSCVGDPCECDCHREAT